VNIGCKLVLSAELTDDTTVVECQELEDLKRFAAWFTVLAQPDSEKKSVLCGILEGLDYSHYDRREEPYA
jgi:hypothetical protein